MKFGENLKFLRKSKKISQEELADKVGVSRQSVSKWEVGDAYPEMNNILQLCKIFHCEINDLVHANMSDIDSLDEEIKMKVVKLNEQEQKKMKGISKTIKIISKIGNAITLIASVVIILTILTIPFIINKVEVVNSDIKVGNFVIGVIEKTEELNMFESFMNTHTNIELIIYLEMVLICLLVTVALLMIIFKLLEKLFDNINKGDTPFTLENISYIKKIALYMILFIVFPIVTGFIMQLILNIDLGIELGLKDVILVLIVYAISYIFEYGYELQKDSKGVMYGKD